MCEFNHHYLKYSKYIGVWVNIISNQMFETNIKTYWKNIYSVGLSTQNLTEIQYNPLPCDN